MSAREFKPGDVAIIAKNSRHVGKRAMLCDDGQDRVGWSVEATDGLSMSFSSSSLRPLAVIDPEDREHIERLHALWCEAIVSKGTSSRQIDSMQAALREFAEPKPRIEEPTGLGAVVRDTEGAVLVRTPGVVDRPAHWADMSGSFYTWADLDVAEILHKGWSE